jgi:hypothetical protein
VAGVVTRKHNHREEMPHGGDNLMRETTLVPSARRLSAPILAELAHLIGRSSWPFDDADSEDAELIEDDAPHGT